MAIEVTPRPKWLTSMGRGKRPSISTRLDWSAITTMRFETAATIFSRSSAPPAPLIRFRPGPISSAPSTVRSSSGVVSRSVSGIPRLSAWAWVTSEVGTQSTSSPSATASPTRSTKCFAVEPVPNPSLMPGRTSTIAALAARHFGSLLMDRPPPVAVTRQGAQCLSTRPAHAEVNGICRMTATHCGLGVKSLFESWHGPLAGCIEQSINLQNCA